MYPVIGPQFREEARFGRSLDFGDSHHLAIGATGYGYLSGLAEGAVFIYGSDRIFGANFD